MSLSVKIEKRLLFLERFTKLLYKFTNSLIMKNIFLISLFLIISNCSLNLVDDHHGVFFIEKKMKKIQVQTTNKNDIIKIFGEPSTKSTFDNDVWIYIERKITNTHFFGKRKLVINNVMVLEIDRIMLLDMMGTTEVGIYTTAALFGVVVNVPSRSLRGISGAVISEAWKNNDLKTISTVFKKSSLNLQIISGFLFISILICSPYLFTLMKPEYALGINIIIYIALAQFIDAFTSVNTEILSSSTLYKYQTFFIFLMIGLVVSLNYLLIPIYGIKGAAISTMISLSTINIFRTIFIWIKFKIHPFENKNVAVFILLGAVYCVSFFINEIIELNPIFKFSLMMLVITSIYWFFVLKLRLSEEINNKVRKVILLIKEKL